MMDKKGRMKNKQIKKYTCCYCKHEFKTLVGTSGGDKPASSQVKCPNCTNFLKTW